jgi:hypothetical protein
MKEFFGTFFGVMVSAALISGAYFMFCPHCKQHCMPHHQQKMKHCGCCHCKDCKCDTKCDPKCCPPVEKKEVK